MAKKKSSKFLSGAVVGAALGVAAGIFANSETGKKIKKEAEDKVLEFYKNLAPKIKKMKDVGEKEYNDFVSKVVMEHKKNGKFDEVEAKKILKHAQSSWKHIKKNLK